MFLQDLDIKNTFRDHLGGSKFEGGGSSSSYKYKKGSSRNKCFCKIWGGQNLTPPDRLVFEFSGKKIASFSGNEWPQEFVQKNRPEINILCKCCCWALRQDFFFHFEVKSDSYYLSFSGENLYGISVAAPGCTVSQLQLVWDNCASTRIHSFPRSNSIFPFINCAMPQ